MSGIIGFEVPEDWEGTPGEYIVKLLREVGERLMKESPEIVMAIQEFNEINEDKRKWATFEAMGFESGNVVKVHWGVRHSNGEKECAIQTITYMLRKDGQTVVRTKLTHP
jgi:hypothetical protein